MSDFLFNIADFESVDVTSQETARAAAIDAEMAKMADVKDTTSFIDAAIEAAKAIIVKMIAVIKALWPAKTKEDVAEIEAARKVSDDAKKEVERLQIAKRASVVRGIADWMLVNKHFDAIMDGKTISYAKVAERLAIAAEIAKANIGLFAKVIGGEVFRDEYDGEMTPAQVKLPDGTIVPFSKMKEYFTPSVGDSNDLAKIKASCLTIWQSWMDATVPSIDKVALAYPEYAVEGLEKKLALKALFTTTKEVNDKIRECGYELGSSYATSLSTGNWRMTSYLLKTSSKEAKEVREALQSMDEDQKKANAFAFIMEGILHRADPMAEVMFWSKDQKGIPVVPHASDLKKMADVAIDAAKCSGWGWQKITNSLLGLYENGIVDAMTIGVWSGLAERIQDGFNKSIQDSRSIAAKEIAAYYEFKKNSHFCYKCSPWSCRNELKLNVSGQLVKTSNLFFAYFLRKVEDAGVFERGEKTLAWFLEKPSRATSYVKESSESWTAKSNKVLRNLILEGFSLEDLATLPDGDLDFVQMPVFDKLWNGFKPRDTFIKELAVSYDMAGNKVGSNLYGMTLQVLRDEARSKIDKGVNRKPSRNLKEETVQQITAEDLI